MQRKVIFKYQQSNIISGLRFPVLPYLPYLSSRGTMNMQTENLSFPFLKIFSFSSISSIPPAAWPHHIDSYRRANLVQNATAVLWSTYWNLIEGNVISSNDFQSQKIVNKNFSFEMDQKQLFCLVCLLTYTRCCPIQMWQPFVLYSWYKNKPTLKCKTIICAITCYLPVSLNRSLFDYVPKFWDSSEAEKWKLWAATGAKVEREKQGEELVVHIKFISTGIEIDLTSNSSIASLCFVNAYKSLEVWHRCA